jgi:hypothetical protein
LKEVTLTELKYEGCELAGLSATVTVSSGCHYTLKPGTIITGGSTGAVDLSVTEKATCEIKIANGKCTLTVSGPQTGLESITYTNVKTGAKEEITAHVSIGQQIKYTKSAGCLTGAGEGKTLGTYEETITAQGFKEECGGSEQTDLTVAEA